MIGVREENFSSEEGIARSSALYAMFLLISFFGWVLEEVFFFGRGRGFADRGFLSSPLCIVYGLGIIAVYLVMGVPHRMRFFSLPIPVARSRTEKLSHLLFYVLLSGVICTLAELLVGIFMLLAFGILMWDYREMPLHIGPYICLPFALIWGILAYFFMRYAFLFFFRSVMRMRKRTFLALFLPLSVFLLFDLSMNCTYAFVHRAHMALW